MATQRSTLTPQPCPRAAIAYHAAECLKALQCADFAERELPGAATGFRKLAALHADQAFGWVPKLAVQS